MIRPATDADFPAIDRLIRTTSQEASPLPEADYPQNFLANTQPADVLVAVDGKQVLGFVKVGPATPLATNAHVLLISGLAVDPAHQGTGLGRRLALAAIDEASARGARRLRLHVLGGNGRARALYSSLGFVVEGVLREEFLLGEDYVDDVLMALPLA
jgi:ribosomal protein S18 acetylase RimI-like enzyme